jgi:tellurite methyltransferase
MQDAAGDRAAPDELTAVDDRPPAARDRWNRRYRERDPATVLGPPSEWLIQNRAEIDRRAPGRALDLACGTGRNAVHLAERGFTVDALDVSDVAIAALDELAQKRGLVIRARVSDLEREPLPQHRYDVVVLINYLQRSLFEAIPSSLTPDGILVAETVTRAHIEEVGRPFDPSFVLESGELEHAFPGMTVVRYQEEVTERSGRPRAVASLLPRRQAI